MNDSLSPPGLQVTIEVLNPEAHPSSVMSCNKLYQDSKCKKSDSHSM